MDVLMLTKLGKIDSMGMWDISMPLYLFHRLRRLLNTHSGREYAIILSLSESSRGNKAEGNQALLSESLLVQLSIGAGICLQR